MRVVFIYRSITHGLSRVILMKIIPNMEILSERARRVLHPLLVLTVVMSVAWAIYGNKVGYHGLTSGTVKANGYLVRMHGHIVHISATKYWLVNALGLVAISCWTAWFLVRAHYRRTGDLQRPQKPLHVV